MNFKKIRGTSATTHRLTEFFELHSCCCSDYIGYNYFHKRFFYCIGAIPHLFATCSANNHTSDSDSAPKTRERRVKRENLGDRERYSGGVAETDLLSLDYSSNSWGAEKSNPDGLDESDGSEEVEVGKSEEEGSDDEFRVLDSFDRNREQNEASRRVEVDEADLRHPLVREVSRLIDHRAAWTPKLESELKRLLRSLKPRQVCAVLRSQPHERIALNFFYWADRQWRYRHYPVVYHEMLNVLSKTKLCQGAKRVLRLMIRRKFELWPEDFGCVMVSFSRAGHISKALQVLNVMQRAGVELCVSVCNTAVNVLVEGKRLEKALRFCERMQVVGIEPSVVTYNCLVKGYCERNEVENAVKMIDEMPLRSCLPDKVSYYTVMGVLCKEKRIDELRKLLEKMKTECKLFPDQITYNTLIHMLCKNGYGDEALAFLREAEEKGFHINKVGHTAIVDCFCKEGKIDKAKDIIDQMLLKGCSPDVTYTAVLNGYCRVGKVDQAKKLLQHMYKHGLKPNCVSYTALLNGLCKGGNSFEAREIMDISEGWWSPNAATYSVIFHGFRREGKLSESCDVVMEMISKGFYPSPVEINLLIQSLCRAGKTEQAKKLMEECLKKGCAVNVVNYTTVIHGFCQNDDLESALSVFDDMYLNNKYPDAVTYTAVVDALGRKGRIDEATEMIKKMLHRGLLPTPVTYRSLIHHFCHHKRINDLLKLMDKLLPRQSFKTAYNQIIEKLCVFGEGDEAYKLLGRVLRTGSKSDADTCHVVMRSFLKKDDPVGSYRVASRMFNRNLVPELKLCEEVSKKLVLQHKLEEADKLMLRFVVKSKRNRECNSRNQIEIQLNESKVSNSIIESHGRILPPKR